MLAASKADIRFAWLSRGPLRHYSISVFPGDVSDVLPYKQIGFSLVKLSILIGFLYRCMKSHG